MFQKSLRAGRSDVGGGVEPFPESPSSQMDKCCTKNTAKTKKKLARYYYVSINETSSIIF